MQGVKMTDLVAGHEKIKNEEDFEEYFKLLFTKCLVDQKRS